MELSDATPARREAAVWFVELAASPRAVEECSRLLSADEKQRASQFRFEHLSRSYTLSRAILRILLGRYLGVEPAVVRFTYGKRGKPSVAFPESALEFNLAHSGEFAAYAFTTGCPLGVDIERVRPVPDQESIVRRFFSPKECEEWLRVAPSEREAAFYRCWTRKEAYIKAIGDGLSLGLDSFQVSLRPGEPAALISADQDPEAQQKWSLYALPAPAGYEASLAIPQRDVSVRVLAGALAGDATELKIRSS
jgi:4'-phosphopantetheinyl transferase